MTATRMSGTSDIAASSKGETRLRTGDSSGVNPMIDSAPPQFVEPLAGHRDIRSGRARPQKEPAMSNDAPGVPQTKRRDQCQGSPRSRRWRLSLGRRLIAADEVHPDFQPVGVDDHIKDLRAWTKSFDARCGLPENIGQITTLTSELEGCSDRSFRHVAQSTRSANWVGDHA